MFEQFQNAFEHWRSECETVDREMGRIVGVGLSMSDDERQVRRFQYASLVERRNAAALKLLAARRTGPTKPQSVNLDALRARLSEVALAMSAEAKVKRELHPALHPAPQSRASLQPQQPPRPHR
jgi:hypothetical protein